MRIDHGPCYRVYFVQHGEALVILLAGGDKRSQRRDARKALELAAGLQEKEMPKVKTRTWDAAEELRTNAES